MSLEDALNANTAAILAQNALLAKIAGAPAGAAGKPAGTAAAGTKPAGAAAGTKPAGTKPAGKKAETTSEHVAKVVTAYLKGGDADERAQRKANVTAIVGYYGAERFTMIDPSQYDEALGFLKQFENGEDPFADDGSGTGEGDGDDDSVV